MREDEAVRRQRLAYEKTLYRYSSALARGDLDTISAILHTAENDPHLEQLIMETHREGYQQEELPMQPEHTHKWAMPLPYRATISGQFQQPLAIPQRPRPASKPSKRWLITLQTTAAILVVAALLISAFFVFRAHNNAPISHTGQPRTGSGTHNDTTKQVGDIIVTVTANMTPVVVRSGTLTALNARTHAAIWRYALGDNVYINGRIGSLGLAVQDHVVYIAYNKQVLAFQANNGKLLWKTALGTGPILAVDIQFAIDHGRIYASGFIDGNLYALDSQTGKILWHYNTPMPVLLTVSNGIAYIQANEDNDHNAVKALNGANGHILWQYNSPMPLEATMANNTLYVQAGHPLTNDPYGDHKEQKPLFALNAITGKLLWSTIAPADSPSQLVIAQGMLVLFDGNHFCGYRTSNGSHAWCTTGPINNIGGEGLVSVLGIVYGIYSASFTESTVVAINPQNGHLYWSTGIKSGGDPQLIALGDTLILPEIGLVLDRTTGKVLWQLSGFITAIAVGN